MVSRDPLLFAFWLALTVGVATPGITLMVVFRQTKDAVPGTVGLLLIWLAAAFSVNATIRCVGLAYELQLALVAWQRACYAVAVIFGIFATDAIVRAHNGRVPHIRRVVRWWERELT